MIVRGAINHGGEEEGIFQESLDGFDEKRREVPCVGKRRSKSSGMVEICIEGRRFREVAKVFKSSRMSCDVFFVWRF